MRFLWIAFLALQPATVIDVCSNSQVTLAVQIGDVLYTAEFSRHDLKPESIHEGDRVQAEVKGHKLIVKIRQGKKITAPIIRVQRTIVHPIQP